MDRRKFLKKAMYFTVASASSTLVACGGSGGSSAIGDGRNTEALGTFKFTHGVASGDPKAASVVFWTRCTRAPNSVTTNDTSDIPLRLEVSPTASFANLVASVNVTASAIYDFTVRAKVTNLTPGTGYFYRFVAGSDNSPMGLTKTAPAANVTPAQIRFAWITCQDYSVNHWGAFELLATEDLDFVLHLGDYIYESVGAGFQDKPVEPAHLPRITFPDGTAKQGGGFFATSLEDYRLAYRTYRADPRLQEVHRKFPMIPIWDDHEFSDDCWQDHQTYTNENKQETGRRRFANQAWAEYMPIDFGDLSFDMNNASFQNIRIYRDFDFGTLIHLVMTDERLYRDDHVVSEAIFASIVGHDPVNGNDSIGARFFIPQPLLNKFEALSAERLGRAPSILGPTQTDWFKQSLKNTSATWKVWGNEVTLNRMFIDLRTSAPSPFDQLFVVNADGWDGFPTHKADLLSFIKNQGIKNVVAVTGDLHAFQAGVVRDTQDAAGTPVIADFVVAGISSTSDYQSLKDNAGTTPLAPLVATPATYNQVLRGNNPDFAFLDQDSQGYAVATVTPTSFTVLFNKVKPLNADGTKPVAPLLKRTRITLPVNTLAPLVEDNVS